MSVEKFGREERISYTELCRRRSRARLKLGLEAWERVQKTFDKLGVKAEIFGSMARGDPESNSDLDILVTDRAGRDELTLLLDAEMAAGFFPVDVVCADKIPAHTVERMRREAKIDE